MLVTFHRRCGPIEWPLCFWTSYDRILISEPVSQALPGNKPLTTELNYLVSGDAKPVHPYSPVWHSQGKVFKRGRGGSLIEVKRLDGGTVSTKEEAIARGLELAKVRVDEQRHRIGAVRSKNVTILK